MGSFLIFLLFSAIFAGVAWWHVGENRELTRKWQIDFNADSANRLTRFAWSRTLQLLVTLACCMMIIIIYNHRLNNASDALVAANKPEEARQTPTQKPAAKSQFIPMQNRMAMQQKPAAPATPPATAPVADSYYPPLVTQPKPTQTPPPTAPPRTTIEEVYNPEQQSNSNEAAMDGIKKRYEGILVTFMFMKQCGRAGANDYPIIISALAQEMASVNAPGRMQYDVITSAQGSYKEMYSQSRCDDPNINTLATQYADYIKALSNNIAAR